MEHWLRWLLCIAGAYVIGSIPFGVIIGRVRGVDIRSHGSRNIGATNVTRVLGRTLGGVCLVLDVLKGAGPVLAAGLLCGVIGQQSVELSLLQQWLWLAVAVAAVLGHMASMFIGLAGGKGVATGFGAMLAMWPVLTLPAIGALVVWYTVLRLSRYVSLSSMLAAASLPMWYVVAARTPADMLEKITRAYPTLIMSAVMAAVVIWRHRANIGRLRRGEEPRAGEAGTEARRHEGAKGRKGIRSRAGTEPGRRRPGPSPSLDGEDSMGKASDEATKRRRGKMQE